MRRFLSKILLFGEHIVLNGALSLAIPFDKHYAYWVEDNEDKSLIKFLDFCKTLSFVEGSDLDVLSDRQLVTNIPLGYGLGSSGALCAAVYEHLFPDHNNKDDNSVIAQLAAMEGHFHGKSSGLDAFTILKNQSIVYSTANLSIIDALDHPFLDQLYLIDSGVSRSSKDLIAFYLKNKADIPSELVTLNNAIVSALIEAPERKMHNEMRELSKIQLDVFKPMILPDMEAIWKTGLASDAFYMKLCGAGGGGYYLAWGDGDSIESLPYMSIKVF